MKPCPRCFERSLQPVLATPGAEVCPHCRGAWVGSVKIAPLLEPRFGPLDGLPMVPPPYAALRCPDCRSELVRRRIADIEVDICGTHGIWFDHRELERVEAAARRTDSAPKLGATAVAAAVVAGAAAVAPLEPVSQGLGPGEVVELTLDAADVAVSTIDIGGSVIELLATIGDALGLLDLF